MQDEVEQLHTAGMAYHEIASTLRGNHPEIADLSNLSAMAIQRYLSDNREKEVEKEVREGKDPVKDFAEEYRQAMKDINIKSNALYERTIKLLDSISESDDDIMKLKAIKEARDGLHLLKDNQVAIAQYGDKKATAITNVFMKKELHVKNYLMNYTKCLCPKCKLKIAEIIELEGD